VKKLDFMMAGGETLPKADFHSAKYPRQFMRMCCRGVDPATGVAG
jgi:hypothetical protein